jgi:hypothetical protein
MHTFLTAVSHVELEEEYYAALLLHQQDPEEYPVPEEPTRVHTVTIGSDPKFREWYRSLSHDEREEFRVHVDETRKAEVNKTCGSTRVETGLRTDHARV